MYPDVMLWQDGFTGMHCVVDPKQWKMESFVKTTSNKAVCTCPRADSKQLRPRELHG